MAKANTRSERPADSASFLGTSPNSEGPPPAGGAQDASWTEGSCDAAAVAAVTATPKPPRFYTMAEVAEMFGRQPRTVRHWIARGLLKCTKVGKAVFITEHEIDALAASTEVLAGGKT